MNANLVENRLGSAISRIAGPEQGVVGFGRATFEIMATEKSDATV